MPKNISQEIADKIATQAVQQLEDCLKFKQPRVKDWQKNEDLYLGKTKPALKGRFNVPLPIMSGFIDTMLAEIQERPSLMFEHTKDSDILKAKKVTSMWELDSDSKHANWPRKNEDAKKIASLYGFAGFKVYSESDPKYKHHLDLIDPYDFIFEPLGGANLEDHKVTGQDNVFRSEYQLKSGSYDVSQVDKLVSAQSDATYSKTEIAYRNKVNRFAALGLDGNFTNNAGDRLFRLAELCTVYEGERYYVFVEPSTKIWVKVKKLKDMYESNLWPFVAFHPYRDAFNFLSKAPADDLRPAVEAMNIIFNQALENRQKLNWGQRAYDSSVFTDPQQLEWRPDGLVEAKARENGVSIRDGIFEFQTPEIRGNLDMMAFMDNFVGQKMGITASAQGATNTDAKASVYFGDMKQVAKRMSLQSRSYSEMIEQMGIRYDWCLNEHLNGDQAVKILGENGVSWQNITKDDTEPDFTIKVVGGIMEMQISEMDKKRKMDSLAALMANPLTAGTLKPHWVAQQQLLGSGFSEEDVRRGLKESPDLVNENDISNASQALQDLLRGKQPKIYNSAGMPFLKKILDFVDNNEVTLEQSARIKEYFTRMSMIVARNMANKAKEVGSMTAMNEVMAGGEGAPGMDQNMMQAGGGIGGTPGVDLPQNQPQNQVPPTPANGAGVGVNKSIYG